MNLFLAPQSLARWWPSFEQWDNRYRAGQAEETPKKISERSSDTPNDVCEAPIITCEEFAQERPAP